MSWCDEFISVLFCTHFICEFPFIFHQLSWFPSSMQSVFWDFLGIHAYLLITISNRWMETMFFLRNVSFGFEWLICVHLPLFTQVHRCVPKFPATNHHSYMNYMVISGNLSHISASTWVQLRTNYHFALILLFLSLCFSTNTFKSDKQALMVQLCYCWPPMFHIPQRPRRTMFHQLLLVSPDSNSFSPVFFSFLLKKGCVK